MAWTEDEAFIVGKWTYSGFLQELTSEDKLLAAAEALQEVNDKGNALFLSGTITDPKEAIEWINTEYQKLYDSGIFQED